MKNIEHILSKHQNRTKALHQSIATMYVIVIAVFLVVIILFWETIMGLVKTMSNSNLQNGYLWFFSLLLINVILISVILGYYYFLTTQTGAVGIPGAPGYPGQSGDECYFTTPNGGRGGGCAS